MRTLILAIMALLAFIAVSFYSFDVPLVFIGQNLLYVCLGLGGLMLLAAMLLGFSLFVRKLLTGKSAD